MTAKDNTTDLRHFISKKMRMAHIYQPVMIKALLENGGEEGAKQTCSRPKLVISRQNGATVMKVLYVLQPGVIWKEPQI